MIGHDQHVESRGVSHGGVSRLKLVRPVHWYLRWPSAEREGETCHKASTREAHVLHSLHVIRPANDSPRDSRQAESPKDQYLLLRALDEVLASLLTLPDGSARLHEATGDKVRHCVRLDYGQGLSWCNEPLSLWSTIGSAVWVQVQASSNTMPGPASAHNLENRSANLRRRCSSCCWPARRRRRRCAACWRSAWATLRCWTPVRSQSLSIAGSTHWERHDAVHALAVTGGLLYLG